MNKQYYSIQQRILEPGHLIKYEYNNFLTIFLVLNINREMNSFTAFVLKQTYNDTRNGSLKQFTLSIWEGVEPLYVNEI